MPFNLLGLPYLARKEVFQHMPLIDLFEFAQCSNKAKRLVKSEYSSKGHTMFLVITDDVCFVANNALFVVVPMKKLHNVSIVQCRKIGGADIVLCHQDTCADGEPSLETYWDDTFLGARQMRQELQELFSIEIDYVEVHFDKANVEYQPFVNWLNTFNPRIKTQIFHGQGMDFHEYMWILENVKSGGHVDMVAKPREYFKKETLKIDAESLEIAHAEWIEVKHLHSLNCSKIWILNVSLTDTDLNLFLKGLVAGSNPNLMKITIEFKRAHDMNTIMDGTEYTKQENDISVKWKINMENGDVCYVESIEFEANGELGIEINVEKS